jgi:hypothetical protein
MNDENIFFLSEHKYQQNYLFLPHYFIRPVGSLMAAGGGRLPIGVKGKRLSWGCLPIGVKCKRLSCPCALTEYHALKAYWGSGGRASLIL